MTFNKSGIINIIPNNNFDSIKTCEVLTQKLESKGFTIPKEYDANAELNICIGGDGAFLRAVHNNYFSSIPYVGINTGHLGFFQEILPEKIDSFIDNYINDAYFIEEIFLVEANVCTKTDCINLLGINEIVIKGIESKVVHLEVFIDDNHLEKFSGDGLIVSTPVGSTAYNYSSAGCIVYPTLKTLQLTPLSPISSKAYRSLLNSAIIPGDMTIKIKPEYLYENSILIINDGVQNKYDDIVEVSFNMSKTTIFRLVFDKDMYWNNLKSKFL
ncbi:NAD(+)/NADH kinase [Anaerosalibacter sp. Marseille-P3206]|uniref:NAD(+)/NADH kinase n=1 Tax=Anaerosalibacter sp. Marseille-P3206 TaxID=1871005 RepID=UPI0009873E8C|nr:NAD(+)/NADH kinase [Anaerosalibacter sp. Marseille-P3206]